MDLRVDREGELPLGTQLAWRLRGLIESGELGPGERLPSVREAAAAAGVNVNTVRAVYGRLERDGLVSSEQGRGTFVRRAAREVDGREGQARRALRREIARLEAELARRPPPPSEAWPARRGPASGGALLSAAELEGVRDGLLERLAELDRARADLIRRLGELPAPESEEGRSERPARSSPTLTGARVRWVGA
jgi:GntR family transcriptional regulator